MKFTPTTILLSTLLTAPLALSKICQGSECVALYSGTGCQRTTQPTNYVPTCNSPCYQYSSIDSVWVTGSAIEGTDCHIFSDPNCQYEILDTGNQLGESVLICPGLRV
ncbi:hypothetical protein DFH08DRAFT_454869 [Mycena albidolilacea]|uniref:Uncharacterized protein n=1 Tax=Mycena albidolilacea TaxID=1033008 RepID=A0AAD7EBZ7_9AGAR|nr:hypothetical protein DFH08DRAFT_454869 [Mycena albidolilacea]